MAVELYAAHGKAFVWTACDARQLRRAHNVTGVLSGTLGTLAQQNQFLGLPLVLLPEEAALLVDHDFAMLFNDAASHLPATTTQAASHAHACTNAEAAEHELNERRQLAKEAEVEHRFAQQIEAKRAHTVTITGRTIGPWHEKQRDAVSLSPDLRITETMRAVARGRRGVFEDLWQRGHFLGGALRFGGDYLVYPGDSLRFHSHFTATVLPATASVVDPLHIVAHGRLATGVKKAHLYAALDVQGAPRYLTLEWSGF